MENTIIDNIISVFFLYGGVGRSQKKQEVLASSYIISITIALLCHPFYGAYSIIISVRQITHLWRTTSLTIPREGMMSGERWGNWAASNKRECEHPIILQRRSSVS